jgi:hypothetical protein
VPQLRWPLEEGVLRGRHCLQGLRFLPERQPRLLVEQFAGHREAVDVLGLEAVHPVDHFVVLGREVEVVELGLLVRQ